MYELYDACTTMLVRHSHLPLFPRLPSFTEPESTPSEHRFFYRNKHIMIDLGTGNNNKINWAIEDKQEVSPPLSHTPRVLCPL